MTVFLATLLARILDPAMALIICTISGLIGSYRIAMPAGAVIYASVMLGTHGQISWPQAISCAVAGAALAVVGVFISRRIPEKIKRALIKE